MKISGATLVRGVSWTVTAYAFGQLIRFTSNVILTRLLTPELFGVIAIINSIRNGIELLTDLGIGQSMIVSKDSDKPHFYNTVWSLQIVRGCLLWILSLLAALPLANFYQTPVLAYLLPVACLPFVFSGLSSTGFYVAWKRMQFVRLSVFDVVLEFITGTVNVVVAIVYPSVWALVVGIVAGGIARLCGSYYLVPNIRNRFHISKEYKRQIIAFSKWILLSSVVFFLTLNFDSLYLGKAGSFELLGIYGIARALSQQIVSVVNRLANNFIFPIVASSNQTARSELRGRIKRVRGLFLLVVVAGLSLTAVTGDLVVAILYDHRYQAAGLMLPILVIGAWFSSLCTVNESILLGIAKPFYAALANSVKMVWLLFCVPFAFRSHGALGVVVVVAISDFWRYIPVLIGQMREGISFGTQDFFVTLAGIAMVVIWELLRVGIGFGATPV